MAEKRMFTKKITDSDAFLNMPLSAQALYFHLNMAADDEGFVNNPKKIQRVIGAAEDDLKLLMAKNFIIAFDSGVIVIKHWKMHNYIAKDRFHPTDYTDEKKMLEVKENGAYTVPVYNLNTECIQDDDRDKNRLDKSRVDKNRLEEINTSCGVVDEPPTPQEPVFIRIPLNDKTEFDVTESMVAEFKEAYPAVDVEQQLRNMRQWCLASTANRKTRKGALRFITNWLIKDQNRGGSRQQRTVQSSLDEWAARKDGENK